MADMKDWKKALDDLRPMLKPENVHQAMGLIEDAMMTEVARQVVVKREAYDYKYAEYERARLSYENAKLNVRDTVSKDIREGVTKQYQERIAELESRIRRLMPDAEFGRKAQQAMAELLNA